jgi:hypothetical protein
MFRGKVLGSGELARCRGRPEKQGTHTRARALELTTGEPLTDLASREHAQGARREAAGRKDGRS